MPSFLIGILFHEPDRFAMWKRGVIEDYESSTGLFIEADSIEEAIAWGEHIGEALLRHENQDTSLDWKSFGHYCWEEPSPESSPWSHCLDFFLHVQVGEMPNLDRMGTKAFIAWQEQRDRSGGN